MPHRLADLGHKAQWNLGPPRLRDRASRAATCAAEAADDFRAVAVLAAAVQSRRTTAERVLDALDGRSRIARRGFLTGVLRDIAEGTCSVLEHGYLTRVERPPRARPSPERQVAASSRGPIYRDVEYRRHGLVLELDGRVFHASTEARDRDLDRDLDAAVRRPGHRPAAAGVRCSRRSCWTAVRIAPLLQMRGWAAGRDGAVSSLRPRWR